MLYILAVPTLPHAHICSELQPCQTVLSSWPSLLSASSSVTVCRETDATVPSYKMHVRLSVIVAEASLSKAGRPRLRAWEHSHAGQAHGAAATIERLGVLAFCKPSKVKS